MAHKEKFEIGQRVTAKRSHDKATVITGKIVKIHEGNDDCVDIETEPDGIRFEVSTLETVHAADVTAAEEE